MPASSKNPKTVSILRVSRVARALDQATLAHLAGTTQQRISQIELGRIVMTEPEARRIAAVLNIRVSLIYQAQEARREC